MVHCLPVTRTRRINTPAQPWRKLGNCGPPTHTLVLRLISACFTTLIRSTPTLSTSEPYVYPPSATADRLRHRAAYRAVSHPRTDARLHLVRRPSSVFFILAFSTPSGTRFVLLISELSHRRLVCYLVPRGNSCDHSRSIMSVLCLFCCPE